MEFLLNLLGYLMTFFYIVVALFGVVVAISLSFVFFMATWEVLRSFCRVGTEEEKEEEPHEE